LPAETDWETELEDCLPVPHKKLESRSSSGLLSIANTRSERRGRTLTDDPGLEKQLLTLLEHAWTDGFTVMSNYAQSNMELVAMASSLQLITTRVNRDVFSRNWQITSKGLRWLNEAKELD
jgi:hypothetical protein